MYTPGYLEGKTDPYPFIDAMTERQPVINLGKEITHVGRVLGLHLTLEPVHLVHVFT